MEAMTSFHAEKCCYLLNGHTAPAQHLCSSANQFLICSTSVLVLYQLHLLQVRPHPPKWTYWSRTSYRADILPESNQCVKACV